MGITGRGLNRFRNRVDQVLQDAFPCVLVIGGAEVNGSGPGGRAVSVFLDGGASPDYRFPFRVPKAGLVTKPETGDPITWRLTGGELIQMEVLSVSERPHEDRWSFECKPTRQ